MVFIMRDHFVDFKQKLILSDIEIAQKESYSTLRRRLSCLSGYKFIE